MIVPSDTWGEVSRVGGDKWEPDTRQKFSFNSLSILHLKDENKASSGYILFSRQSRLKTKLTFQHTFVIPPKLCDSVIN